MTVTLREMERGDVAAVARIEAASNPQPWSESLFAGELVLPAVSRHWLLAEASPEASGDRAEPTIVGFGGVMYASDTAHLMNLGVEPAWRRRSVGRQLCLALFVEARDRGAAEITLEVRAPNTAARALYEQIGMVAEGRRPGYYPDGTDAVIYWLRDLADDAVGDRLEGMAQP
ncbi:MAG: GNAT family N-acetyltransferase [Actinomycetota bacterium]